MGQWELAFPHSTCWVKWNALFCHADLETTIHAFISSSLDYCNASLTGINQSSIQRLQFVQNDAAHILTNAPKLNLLSQLFVNNTGFRFILESIYKW